MNSAAEFFLKESIAHARGMKLSDSVIFLRGMLESCSDKSVVEQIRPMFVQLSESDKQLELIQIGQLKLNIKDGE